MQLNVSSSAVSVFRNVRAFQSRSLLFSSRAPLRPVEARIAHSCITFRGKCRRCKRRIWNSLSIWSYMYSCAWFCRSNIETVSLIQHAVYQAIKRLIVRTKVRRRRSLTSSARAARTRWVYRRGSSRPIANNKTIKSSWRTSGALSRRELS